MRISISQSFSVTAKEIYISEIMKQDFLRMIDSFRPLLLSYGFFEETVERWTTNAKDEVQNVRHKLNIRVSYLASIEIDVI